MSVLKVFAEHLWCQQPWVRLSSCIFLHRSSQIGEEGGCHLMCHMTQVQGNEEQYQRQQLGLPILTTWPHRSIYVEQVGGQRPSSIVLCKYQPPPVFPSDPSCNQRGRYPMVSKETPAIRDQRPKGPAHRDTRPFLNQPQSSQGRYHLSCSGGLPETMVLPLQLHQQHGHCRMEGCLLPGHVFLCL